MNIDHLEAFVYVNHFESFRKAADALFLSQPSVSARIQSLERELNTKLFMRKGKQFHLTEQGKNFLPYAEEILKSYQNGKKQLHVPNEKDQVTIGSNLLMAQYYLPYLLPYLSKCYPNVTFKTMTTTNDSMLEAILNQQVEFGLMKHTSHPGVDSFKLLDNQIHLIVPPDHELLSNEKPTIEDISHHPIVFYQCGSFDWAMIHKIFEALPETPNIGFHTDNLEVAKELIRHGKVGFLPELSVMKELREGTLMKKKLNMLSVSHQISLVSLKGTKSVFTDRVKEIYQQFNRSLMLA